MNGVVLSRILTLVHERAIGNPGSCYQKWISANLSAFRLNFGRLTLNNVREESNARAVRFMDTLLTLAWQGGSSTWRPGVLQTTTPFEGT